MMKNSQKIKIMFLFIFNKNEEVYASKNYKYHVLPIGLIL